MHIIYKLTRAVVEVGAEGKGYFPFQWAVGRPRAIENGFITLTDFMVGELLL